METKYIVGLGIIAVWLAMKGIAKATGPVKRGGASWWKKFKTKTWPAIKRDTTVFTSLPLLIGVGVIAAWPSGGSVPEPVEPAEVKTDLLDKCHEAQRVLLAERLREFAGTKLASVEEAEDALNQILLDTGTASYEPLFKEMAEAYHDNRMLDFSNKLKDREVAIDE
jgi:hypothetical protein